MINTLEASNSEDIIDSIKDLIFKTIHEENRLSETIKAYKKATRKILSENEYETLTSEELKRIIS